MAEEKMIRLGQASRKLNVGHNTILEFLSKKGFSVDNNPNAKPNGTEVLAYTKFLQVEPTRRIRETAQMGFRMAVQEELEQHLHPGSRSYQVF